jgi:coproporphyrinogen III oxidase-like Fe-S oxidoreductase
MLEHYKSNGWIDIDESGFYLTNKGRLIGDELSANLFES